MVMTKPVGDQHVLAVGLLYQVFQHIQLFVMDCHDFSGVGVNRAVRHLQELPRQDGGIGGIDLLTFDMDQKVLLHPLVQLSLGRLHHHFVRYRHIIRHVQIVQRLHGDGDIGDPLIDAVLRSLQWDVVENHSRIGVHSSGTEEGAAVLADESPQPLTPVD